MSDRELEIDFRRIWDTLRHNALCILALAAEGAIAMLLGTMLLVTPRYQSEAVFYVSNSASVTGGTIRAEDLAAAKTLGNSYRILLQTRETLDMVCAYAGVPRSWEEIREMIQASPVESTEFFEVRVTSPDPQEAEQIANAVAQVLPYQIDRVLGASSARIVDSAIAASQPIPAHYGRNAVLGGLAGLLLALGYACGESIRDTTIRSRREAEEACPCPILAEVRSREGYGEGCRLLRTKLDYLLAEKATCPLLGITSARRGEGKNRVAEHLVRSLARAGKRAVLIDCDIRREKQSKGPRPLGLTDYLSGRSGLPEVVQQHTWGNFPFFLIAPGSYRGDFPELLASAAMGELLDSLRETYDDVILNLPVMAEAGDALSLAGKTDGIVLALHRDVCRREDLDYALGQLGFVGAPLLGAVYQEETAGKAKRNQPAKLLAGLHGKIKNLAAQTAPSASSDRSSAETQPSAPR